MQRIRFIIAALLGLFVCLGVDAQRLVPGQWDLSFGFTPWMQMGGTVDFDKIDYNHRIVIRAGGHVYRETYDVAENEETLEEPARYMLRAGDLAASGGMLWRVVSNRSRSVNLWMGLTGDVGVRLRKPLAELSLYKSYSRSDLRDIDPVDGVDDGRIPPASFTMGVSPEISFEVFPAKNFSISAFFRPHFQWSVYGKDYRNNEREDVFIPLTGIQLHFYMFVGK